MPRQTAAYMARLRPNESLEVLRQHLLADPAGAARRTGAAPSGAILESLHDGGHVLGAVPEGDRLREQRVTRVERRGAFLRREVVLLAAAMAFARSSE